MTRDKRILINFRRCDGPKVIFNGNDKARKTKGVCTIGRNGLLIEEVAYMKG